MQLARLASPRRSCIKGMAASRVVLAALLLALFCDLGNGKIRLPARLHQPAGVRMHPIAGTVDVSGDVFGHAVQGDTEAEVTAATGKSEKWHGQLLSFSSPPSPSSHLTSIRSKKWPHSFLDIC